ncbi:SDR family NAD(P)-dependent oxidoreductase [Nocardioides sp. W3-2-3]|nr:SDR family NAD(P)-dependent oxidoreductase [Nocardioides convexus]
MVTGANTGIGKETARDLAGRGARVVIAGRSEEKNRAAIREIADDTGNTDLDYVPLDLGDLDSVRAAAATVLGAGEPLHVLINNAGLAGKRGITASGFEPGVRHQPRRHLPAHRVCSATTSSPAARAGSSTSPAPRTTRPRASTGTPYDARR